MDRTQKAMLPLPLRSKTICSTHDNAPRETMQAVLQDRNAQPEIWNLCFIQTWTWDTASQVADGLPGGKGGARIDRSFCNKN